MPFPPSMSPCSDEAIDPQRLAEAMEEIKRRVELLYEQAHVELPTRRMWAVGEVPPECSQLVVSLSSVETDDTEGNCQAALRALVDISVTRCAPVSSGKAGLQPPTAEQVEVSGTLLAKDAWILIRGSCTLDLYNMGDMEPRIEAKDAQGGVQTVTLMIKVVI